MPAETGADAGPVDDAGGMAGMAPGEAPGDAGAAPGATALPPPSGDDERQAGLAEAARQAELVEAARQAELAEAARQAEMAEAARQAGLAEAARQAELVEAMDAATDLPMDLAALALALNVAPEDVFAHNLAAGVIVTRAGLKLRLPY